MPLRTASTASVQVMLFRDRLEVWNPGALPTQLSIETLKSNHGSFPHNPLIADALYYVHYIERMGTGILDIVEKCVNYGLPEPQFVIRDGFVSIIYRKSEIALNKVSKESGEKNYTQNAQDTEQVTEQDTEQVKPSDNQAYSTDNTQMTEQDTEQVTEQVIRLVKILDISENISINSIMKYLKLRHRPTFLYTYIQPALRLGLIEMTNKRFPLR
jgi:predicted HTH transcriptional regulator